MADVLGIIGGKLLAIEVKTLKGKVSKSQKLFLENVNLNGGIGFVARSLEEVKRRLHEEGFDFSDCSERVSKHTTK